MVLNLLQLKYARNKKKNNNKRERDNVNTVIHGQNSDRAKFIIVLQKPKWSVKVSYHSLFLILHSEFLN